jgi:hypothetical protein
MINLSIYLLINALNIRAIEEVLIRYGKLKRGSFSVITVIDTDDIAQPFLVYPKGMGSVKAHAVVDRACKKVWKLTFLEVADTGHYNKIDSI